MNAPLVSATEIFYTLCSRKKHPVAPKHHVCCLVAANICVWKISHFVTSKSVSLSLQSQSACRCKVRKFVTAKSVGLSMKSQSVCYCKVSQFVVFAAAKAVTANCTFAAANLRLEPQTCTFGFVATTFCSCNTPIVASTG